LAGRKIDKENIQGVMLVFGDSVEHFTDIKDLEAKIGITHRPNIINACKTRMVPFYDMLTRKSKPFLDFRMLKYNTLEKANDND
jgi:hypothetical protein